MAHIVTTAGAGSAKRANLSPYTGLGCGQIHARSQD